MHVKVWGVTSLILNDKIKKIIRESKTKTTQTRVFYFYYRPCIIFLYVKLGPGAPLEGGYHS